MSQKELPEESEDPWTIIAICLAGLIILIVIGGGCYVFGVFGKKPKGKYTDLARKGINNIMPSQLGFTVDDVSAAADMSSTPLSKAEKKKLNESGTKKKPKESGMKRKPKSGKKKKPNFGKGKDGKAEKTSDVQLPSLVSFNLDYPIPTPPEASIDWNHFFQRILIATGKVFKDPRWKDAMTNPTIAQKMLAEEQLEYKRVNAASLEMVHAL